MTDRAMSSGCIGCTCKSATPLGSGRVLFATRVSHSVAVLHSVLRELGAAVAHRAPGLLEARPLGASDTATLVAAVRRGLTDVEADEIRVLVMSDEDGDELLAAALSAPTLSTSGSRANHAHLMPLFDDEQNAFYSVYQPIVSLSPSVSPATQPSMSTSMSPVQHPVIGYEALLRVQASAPTGPVSPDQLFTSAASAGWLHVLDRIGRTTALHGAEGWLGDAQLFVNFVPTTIYRPEVCLRTTEQAAERAGLRLDQLVFEVTESEQIADIGHLSTVFDYYRERGCRVALDDLGSGFSSLNRLVELRPDVVKLDKQLVQGLPNQVSSAVIAAIVQMTHSYGGVVLAECVETEEQANAAVELGVDLGQGWYFGRPEPRTAFMPLAAELIA